MVIPRQLKLNKFKLVMIPSAKEIVARYGMFTPHSFSGDEILPLNQSKTDMMIDLDAQNGTALARERAEESES